MHHAIVCQADMRGQRIVHFPMQSHLMAHVNQTRLAGMDALSLQQSFRKRLVRPMWLWTQRIHHQQIEPFQQRIHLIWKSRHIRYPRHAADAISHNGQPAVHHPKGKYIHSLSFRAFYPKRTAGHHRQQGDMRNSGIQMRREAIRHPLLQAVEGILFAIDRNISKSTKGTQIVQSAHVVIMLVRNQYGINRGKTFHPQTLFPEIRTAIDKNTHPFFRLYQSRTAQPLVMRIGTGTDRTGTSHLGNSRRSAAT